MTMTTQQQYHGDNHHHHASIYNELPESYTLFFVVPDHEDDDVISLYSLLAEGTKLVTEQLATQEDPSRVRHCPKVCSWYKNQWCLTDKWFHHHNELQQQEQDHPSITTDMESSNLLPTSSNDSVKAYFENWPYPKPQPPCGSVRPIAFPPKYVYRAPTGVRRSHSSTANLFSPPQQRQQQKRYTTFQELLHQEYPDTPNTQQQFNDHTPPLSKAVAALEEYAAHSIPQRLLRQHQHHNGNSYESNADFEATSPKRRMPRQTTKTSPKQRWQRRGSYVPPRPPVSYQQLYPFVATIVPYFSSIQQQSSSPISSYPVQDSRRFYLPSTSMEAIIADTSAKSENRLIFADDRNQVKHYVPHLEAEGVRSPSQRLPVPRRSRTTRQEISMSTLWHWIIDTSGEPDNRNTNRAKQFLHNAPLSQIAQVFAKENLDSHAILDAALEILHHGGFASNPHSSVTFVCCSIDCEIPRKKAYLQQLLGMIPLN